MKSVMQHNFSQIPKIDIPRSVFNRTHAHKTTFNEGYLVPFLVDEALPGDTFNVHSTLFARLATPITPFMDNLYLDSFYFAVPLRLLWDNFKKFMGEKEINDSTTYLTPVINTGSQQGFEAYSIFDYFGLPVGVPNQQISALPARAYNLIYEEWFRPQDLIAANPISKGDGPDAVGIYPIKTRAKRHDYFTSALMWPQKGAAISLPLGTSAPVIGNGMALRLTDGAQAFSLRNNTYSPDMLQGSVASTFQNTGDPVSPYVGPTTYNLALGLTNNKDHSGLIADLANATAATVNSVRQAFQLQRMLEKDARGGTRYTEVIRNHFGVVSPDARMQRPELLGMSSQRINVNPVQQTSSTVEGSPQGNLSAYALVTDSKGGFTKSFTEHCIILGIMNVRADLTYQQGVPRMFSRRTKYDFYWPGLANLGEQEIWNREIYSDGTTLDNGIFGYQERYAEYRYYPSKITGLLRSDGDNPLDAWHLSEYFETRPILGQTFIEDHTPINRVIAVTEEPHFIFDSFIEMKCARPMPVYSVPGMIDHF